MMKYFFNIGDMCKAIMKPISSLIIITILLLINFNAIAQSRVVKVGVWSNFPVLFVDSDGVVKGFYVDLLSEIGKMEDIHFEYVVDTWDGCLDNIKSGKIDVLAGVGYTNERATFADYGQRPILNVWGELYASKLSDINGIIDISGKRVGVVKSDILTDHFKELTAKFEIECAFVEFGVYDEIFKAIASGEIDAGIAEIPYGMAKQAEFGLKSTGVAFSPTNYFFISPKGRNHDLLKTLDDYLQKWGRDDNSVLEQSKKKWLHGMTNIEVKMPVWLRNTLIVLAIVLIVAFIFIVSLKSRVEKATREIRSGEIRLRESNTYLQAVLSSFNDAVFVHDDISGKIIDVNERTYEMYGYNRREFLETSIADLSQGEAPYSMTEAREWLDKAREIGPQSFEWLAKHKDGHCFWTEVGIRFAVIGDHNRFVVVVHDITERKNTEIELIKAKEHAEESDRLKTAFLQNMSHEIRTPMNAIMGFSELLVENYDNRANLEKYSNIISQRCSDLLDIINDILDISKIESGQLTVKIEECDIHEMFTELHSFFIEQQERNGKQNINFNIHFDDENASSVIKTDKVKLKQILINLIGNSFKFTDKGSIECSCRRKDDFLLFSVSDTGVGIPVDKHDKVFERFSQLRHSTAKNVGGTGLGLSIAKGLAGLLGGEISLQSEFGKGTNVSFTIKYIESDSLLEKPAAKQEITTINLQDKTLLIVEDDFFNTEYLKELLEYTGFKILIVDNGEDAVRIALSEHVDLILMDVRLPDISGYEATGRIRKAKPEIKIIAQTAYAAQDESQKALDAGCIDYISKPINREVLLSMIGSHL